MDTIELTTGPSQSRKGTFTIEQAERMLALSKPHHNKHERWNLPNTHTIQGGKIVQRNTKPSKGKPAKPRGGEGEEDT